MANDYFQDITPESGTPIRYTTEGPRDEAGAPVPSRVSVRSGVQAPPTPPTSPMTGEKSIRNVTVQRTRPRAGGMGGDIRPDPVPVFAPEPPRKRRSSRLWIWILALASILVLGGALLAFALKSTTVRVKPLAQPIVFDATVYGASLNGTATGTIPYTVKEFEFEDSAVVPAQGTERAEDKATGTVIVYNNYSTTPQRLIKNTRFETPQGLVFRIPESIVVPGKNGSTPGQLQVTVFADQPGEAYNVGPVEKLTLPGLKSTADMYAGIYARSTAAMSGGFVGERPAVAPGAMESARSEVRARLEKKAQESALAVSSESLFVLPSLVQISYQSLPSTTEAGGGLRMHEKAKVVVPVFSPEVFGAAIAQGVTAADTSSGVRLTPGSGFSATVAEGDSAQIGVGAFRFSLSGAGTLVWDIPLEALTEALAGKDQTVFQTVVEGFPSIQEAHANISPFWRSTFPDDASDIEIVREEPALQVTP